MRNFAQNCVISFALAMSGYNGNCVFAQQLATARQTVSVLEENYPRQNQKMLKQVLEEVGVKYQVTFMFSPDIQEIKIPLKPIEKANNFKEELEGLLHPVGLTYKKLDDTHYIIKKNKEESIQKLHPSQVRKDSRTVQPLLTRSSFSLSQQVKNAMEKNISGKVTDENGEALPGVNVLVKDANTGTITDADGNYKISVEDKVNSLIFSFVGYISEEVSIENKTVINVSLSPDIQSLNEVVVVGYGEVKRADVTGAVVSMDSKQIERANKVDAVSALQGQVPGVVIQNTNNKPGGQGFNIRVRGASTINTNETAEQGGYMPGQNPLFVVDGVFLSDISFLNPADIDKMDVLKDASATAIYGSRGSNGVVIIQTKKGKKGELKIDYSNYFGSKQAYHLPSVYGTPGYIEYLKDVVVGNNFATGNLDYRREDVNIESYLDQEELQNVADGVSTDWVDLILQNGFQTNHTVNLSGGSDKTIYGIGLGYTYDEGTVSGEDFTRYNLRGNLSSDLTNWMKLSYNNYVTIAEWNEGSYEAFRSAYRLKPIGRPYNEDGSWRFWPTSKENQITNPLFDTKNITRETRYLQYVGNVALNIEPFEGLSFTSTFSPNIKYSRYGEYRGLLTKSVVNNQSNTRARVENTLDMAYTWDNIVNYDLELNNNNILKATLVYSQYSVRQEFYEMERRGFSTDSYSFYNVDAGATVNTVASNYTKQTLESFTGRLNYSLFDKYLLTVTGRYDGASILADNNKWAFFPSAAIAWKLSEENFMRSVNAISEAKIRLSYGQTGNNGQGGGLVPLATKSLLQTSYTNIGDEASETYTLSGIANKDLTWERTTEFNLGFDFGFLRNRIYGSLDLYTRETDGIIFYRPLPDVTGFSGIYENVGESMNKGIELGINTVNFDGGDFTWKTGFNFAANRNKITKLYGDLEEILFSTQGGSFINKVGESIGSIYQYQADGVWQLDEADEAAVYGQYPGQAKVKDLNNDGAITADGDRTVIGNVMPKWTAGLTSNMSYKNLDLSFFVYTNQGNMAYSNFHTNLIYPYDNEPSKLFNAYQANYWTPTNPTNDWYQPGNGGPYSDATKYRDVSFVKVGFITLGYTIPETMLERIGVKSLRIYTTVQNPFIFTSYEGWDPESAARNSWGAAFMSRTYMAGLNLSF